MLPGAIAILSPLIIGFLLGPEALGGFLAGATVSGVLMGMFQNNAGGAWDNAKKSFEKGAVINGETYYKGSEPHKASVSGDTVGDPFKDTSGPSMNILIKLMSIVSLVVAPTLAKVHAGDADMPLGTKQEQTITKKIEMNVNGDKVSSSDAAVEKLINELKNDKVITTPSYSVKVQDNQLYIDGKKQDEATNAKYKSFFENKGNFEVKIIEKK
jgi:K(+)-stimulated pyrophosphate-energized sodium pump